MIEFVVVFVTLMSVARTEHYGNNGECMTFSTEYGNDGDTANICETCSCHIVCEPCPPGRHSHYSRKQPVWARGTVKAPLNYSGDLDNDPSAGNLKVDAVRTGEVPPKEPLGKFHRTRVVRTPWNVALWFVVILLLMEKYIFAPNPNAEAMRFYSRQRPLSNYARETPLEALVRLSAGNNMRLLQFFYGECPICQEMEDDLLSVYGHTKRPCHILVWFEMLGQMHIYAISKFVSGMWTEVTQKNWMNNDALRSYLMKTGIIPTESKQTTNDQGDVPGDLTTSFCVINANDVSEVEEGQVRGGSHLGDENNDINGETNVGDKTTVDMGRAPVPNGFVEEQRQDEGQLDPSPESDDTIQNPDTIATAIDTGNSVDLEQSDLNLQHEQDLDGEPGSNNRPITENLSCGEPEPDIKEADLSDNKDSDGTCMNEKEKSPTFLCSVPFIAGVKVNVVMNKELRSRQARIDRAVEESMLQYRLKRLMELEMGGTVSRDLLDAAIADVSDDLRRVAAVWLRFRDHVTTWVPLPVVTIENLLVAYYRIRVRIMVRITRSP